MATKYFKKQQNARLNNLAFFYIALEICFTIQQILHPLIGQH